MSDFFLRLLRIMKTLVSLLTATVSHKHSIMRPVDTKNFQSDIMNSAKIIENQEAQPQSPTLVTHETQRENEERFEKVQGEIPIL